MVGFQSIRAANQRTDPARNERYRSRFGISPKGFTRILTRIQTPDPQKPAIGRRPGDGAGWLLLNQNRWYKFTRIHLLNQITKDGFRRHQSTTTSDAPESFTIARSLNWSRNRAFTWSVASQSIAPSKSFISSISTNAATWTIPTRVGLLSICWKMNG